MSNSSCGPHIGLVFDADQAAAEYASRRYALMAGLLLEADAERLLRSTQVLPETIVHCGDSPMTWSQQDVTSPSPAYSFFERPDLVGLASRLTGLSHVRELHVWTSIYRHGEHIAPHADRDGTVQLLVCIKAPPARDRGGWLYLGDIGVFLRAGDAVMFEATAITHRTTPPIDCTRVVLVGRYYMH